LLEVLAEKTRARDVARVFTRLRLRVREDFSRTGNAGVARGALRAVDPSVVGRLADDARRSAGANVIGSRAIFITVRRLARDRRV
jgi:hypothetical protein